MKFSVTKIEKFPGPKIPQLLADVRLSVCF